MTETTKEESRTTVDIAGQAKELYEWVLRHAQSNKWTLTTIKDKPGFEGELVMRGVCTTLWPQFQGELRRAELDAFIQPIYRYLRETGNAACTFNPALQKIHATPVWFVAQRWNTGKPDTSSLAFRPAAMSGLPTGNHSSGGAISATIGDLMDPNAAAKMLSIAVAARARAKSKRGAASTIADYIEVLLLESEQPLTAEEVLFSLRTEDVQASDWSVRLNLSALIEAGSISIRTETESERVMRNGDPRGRFAALYWHGDDVPQRTVGKLFGGMVNAANDPDRESVETRRAVMRAPGGTDPRLEEISGIVNQIIAEATADLQAELDALRSKLRGILG